MPRISIAFFSAICFSLCAYLPAVHAGELAKPERADPTITPTQFHQDALADPPRTVSPMQLSEWLTKKDVVLIDLRDQAEFDHSHIHGAINIPLTQLTELEMEKREIANDAKIVVYCDYQLAPTRMLALTTLGHPSLQQLGFSQVYTLEALWQSPECKGQGHDVPCADLLPMTEVEEHLP
jgi:hypothetical protein